MKVLKKIEEILEDIQKNVGEKEIKLQLFFKIDKDKVKIIKGQINPKRTEQLLDYTSPAINRVYNLILKYKEIDLEKLKKASKLPLGEFNIAINLLLRLNEKINRKEDKIIIKSI